MNDQRLDFLDFSRGIAALTVFASHVGISTGYFSRLGFRYDWVDLGQIGIIAFFLVSGFVIPLSLHHAKNLRSFAIRRIFRLYPLFLCILCLSLALQLFGIGYPAPIGTHPVSTIASNFFLISEYTKYPNLVGGSWTLSIEIMWYVSFGLLFYFGLHRNLLALAIAVASLFVAVACLSIFMDMRLPLGRLGMLGACLVGYYFYKSFRRQISPRDKHICMTLLFASILFLLWTAFFHHHSERTTFQCVITSWTIGLALFYIPLAHRGKRLFQLPGFMKLGLYSYSIYLAHGPIISFCVHLFSNPAIQLACSLVMVLACSALLYKLVEKPGIEAGKALDRSLASRRDFPRRKSVA